MIISVLGKGGSGKSSVTTQLVFALSDKRRSVLAIDADHNMDLCYNLTQGLEVEVPYFGSAMSEILNITGYGSDRDHPDVFLGGTDTRFSFRAEATDPFTKKYAVDLNDAVRLMVSGPQTDEVMYGKKCSHVLSAPLKIYLPLLEYADDQAVVVDEKAGADGVTTGIVTGVDVAVIVVEPAWHSLKTAGHLAELCRFYGTPYLFVGNKIKSDDDRSYILSALSSEDRGGKIEMLTHSDLLQRDPAQPEESWALELDRLIDQTAGLVKGDRLERTLAKYRRNVNYK